jgi:cytochrome b561
MRINATTRVLHYFMIFCVLYQLISAEFMRVLEPGKMEGFDTILFTLHMMVFGWGAFLIASVYVVILHDDKDGWGRIVPWFSTRHRRAFFQEMRRDIVGTFRGKFPLPEEQGALSGAVHGIGILLILALGFTGAWVMLGVRSDGTMRADTLLVFDFHATFAKLLWIFLIGHVAMFLFHIVTGHRTILDIFERVHIPWK